MRTSKAKALPGLVDQKELWQAHKEANTLHYALTMLRWAYLRFVVVTGLPKLLRFCGMRRVHDNAR